MSNHHNKSRHMFDRNYNKYFPNHDSIVKNIESECVSTVKDDNMKNNGRKQTHEEEKSTSTNVHKKEKDEEHIFNKGTLDIKKEKVSEHTKKEQIINKGALDIQQEKEKAERDKLERQKIEEEWKAAKEQEDKNRNSFPELDVKHISVSYQVISNLKPGSKLSISKNKLYFEEDNYYLRIIYGTSEGNHRDNVIRYLDHIYHETVRNIAAIKENIKKDQMNDKHIMNIQNLIEKIIIFVHHFDNIKEAYINDSNICSQLDSIKNEYQIYLKALFREFLDKK